MKKLKLIPTLFVLLLLFSACGREQAPAPGSLEDEQLFQIETTCGALSYPARWKEQLITEETLQEGGTVIDFSTEVDGRQYPLFSVIINSAQGDTVGTIRAKDGSVKNVFVDIYELPQIESLSRKDQEQLYAMQEGVNDVVEALNES